MGKGGRGISIDNQWRASPGLKANGERDRSRFAVLAATNRIWFKEPNEDLQCKSGTPGTRCTLRTRRLSFSFVTSGICFCLTLFFLPSLTLSETLCYFLSFSHSYFFFTFFLFLSISFCICVFLLLLFVCFHFLFPQHVRLDYLDMLIIQGRVFVFFLFLKLSLPFFYFYMLFTSHPSDFLCYFYNFQIHFSAIIMSLFSFSGFNLFVEQTPVFCCLIFLLLFFLGVLPGWP